MIRARSLRSFLLTLVGIGLTFSACADRPADDPSTLMSEETSEQTSALHNFCGNGRCDHGETCSTCAQDCGR